ncbi:helix-turn-helix domain-containing protein [Gorillibacterium sp. sgz5001074]|uniref:helix-turn-helix domain-containing protein n=1 Tax=Gorillibacterium sp. sgz5001074 TaxID=3446695 RepID=UPI003F674157
MQPVQYDLGRCRGKELAASLGISQQEIAEGTGFSKQEISMWFNNERDMTLPKAFTVAKFMKTSIEQLYEFIPRKPQAKRTRQRKG